MRHNIEIDEAILLIKEDLKDLKRLLKIAKATGKKQLGLSASELSERIAEIKNLLN